MYKTLFKGAIIMFSGLLLGTIGMIVGAYIGGNFLVGFTFNGVRGYEATGQLGFFVGFAIGTVLSFTLLFKRSKRKI